MRTRTFLTFVALAAIGTSAWTVPAEAQLPDLKEALEDRAERELDRKAEEGVESLFRCVWNDLECIRRAEQDGEAVALTDEEGNVLTDEEGRPISDPAEAEATISGQQTGAVVGKIEMVLDGEPRVFEVQEGPVDEGFATGYNVAPRGEAMAMGAALNGLDPATGDQIEITVGVWQETLEHMCDPFANQIRYSPADEDASGGRLRPDGNPSETCPPSPDVMGSGLTVHINLVDATFDAEAEELRVVGTFAGPLGRGDDAIQVSDGRFEAALHPFERP